MNEGYTIPIWSNTRLRPSPFNVVEYKHRTFAIVFLSPFSSSTYVSEEYRFSISECIFPFDNNERS